MADMSLDADGDADGHRRGDSRTLEEHVGKWAARRMRAGVPARRCVLPFLTGAPKAVECRLCSRIIYAGEEVRCSVSRCQEMFHLNCVVKDTSKFTTESFRCPQHGCIICKQKMFFWRCGRCTVAAHTKCAPWPVIHLKDDRGSAICWRHPSDWLLQNENAESTSSIEEVFCRLPLPYVNKNFSDSTIRNFADAVYKPPPYTAIKRNIYLIKKKRTGVRVDTGCTDCRAYSTCKEDCECRALSLSCSRNCRCSGLCTNKPFCKDKKIKIVKTHQCGWGAVALEPLEKGDFIVEYVGEVIDDTTCEQRLRDLEKRGDKNFYMCEISKDFTIDATFKGNVSRFLNHSCEPNCKLEKWQVSGETRVGFFASRAIKIGEPLTYEYRPVRRCKDKVPKCLFLEHQHLPPSHPLDLMCEAIATRRPHNATIGASAQHVASIGEEQNNMNSTQIMVDFGRQGLDHELDQDLHDESLNVSANDADQQAERNDERVTKRPLTRSKRGISKKHKVIAVTLTPCVEETGSVHPEFRSVQANVNESLDVSANDGDQQGQRSDEHVTERPLSASKGGIFKKHKAIVETPCSKDTGSVHPESRSARANMNEQEANQGKDYSISRCLDVLDAMDDVPDGIKILASDVFMDVMKREMFLCYAPKLRGPWLKKEVDKLQSSRLVN
ncbi:hypothetical protein SEVIR_1G233400v4 [Setaria viridis]|uniref:SET domain-containing protein n=1 Tax=Setaria viridis TaxID=4556 RepID=A0A4V6DFN4_SETVI|nr:histone-lysine N-methyltransferase ASHR3-like isoform X1 [Setaria viridis]TKW40246.1 hypothetical protein SEVIR_1G233400v2 [Setaria viridis]